MRDLDQFMRVWTRQGWYPARWAHHPPEVRDLLRAFRWRPQVKQCFANSQRFLRNAAARGLRGVEYHEGYVGSVIPIEHAWLTLNGKLLDLTLDPEKATQYLGSNSYTLDQVLSNMQDTGMYTVIDQEALMKHSPFYESFKEMHKQLGNKETG